MAKAPKMVELYAARGIRVAGKSMSVGDAFRVPEGLGAELVACGRANVEKVKRPTAGKGERPAGDNSEG